MALFIRRDDGSGDFFPDRGGADLLTISNFDTGYGETASGDWQAVTYAQSQTGPCPDRLDELVNTIADPIRIFPVDASFILLDGTPISSVAGVAIPVGDAINPQPADISTVYDTSDCNGAGWCVAKDGGGDTSFPSAAILYHELAHCFHFATGVASTEPLAQTDENDLRDQIGVDRRDPNDHSGGCGGCPYSCCIVASIATGSPFSGEVASLRHLRDSLLRRGPVGADLFDRMLYDYYAMSPEVCRLMATSEELTATIRTWFVVPLIGALTVLRRFVAEPDRPAVLAMAVRESLADPRFEGVRSTQHLELAATVLRSVLAGEWPSDAPAAAGEGVFDGLVDTIRTATERSPWVRWALLEVVSMWLDAATAMTEGTPDEEVAALLHQRAVDWCARLPLSERWDQIGADDARRALAEVGELLVVHPSARRAFAVRVLERRPDLADEVEAFCLAG